MNNMVIAKSTKLSRRTFIVGSAAIAGGGLALGLNVPFGVGSASAQAAPRPKSTSGLRSSPTIPA